MIAKMRKSDSAEPTLLCAAADERAMCVCVYTCACVSLIPDTQKRHVRNLAKHPSCKCMEHFTYVNKHTFQNMMYHKSQFIYIPVSSQSLGNPCLMSICFASDQTFAYPIQLRRN